MPTPSARLDSIESTTNTDTFAGNSISPTGGALLVVCIGVLRTQTGDPTVASVTDTFTGTGTWTIVQATQTASNQMVGAIAYATLGSTPGAGAVTVTLDLNSVRTTIDIYEVTDHDGVNQSKTNIGTDTTLTVTFDSSPASDSLVIGTVVNRVTSDIDVTPGTDFTELGELFSSGPSIQLNLQTQYDAAGADTTTDWSNLESGACVGVAIEILAAASGETVTPGAATAALTAVNPTAVLGNLSITPGNAPLSLAGVDPTAILGSVTAVPAHAPLTLQAIDPAVNLGSLTLAPAAASLALAAINPTVVLGSLAFSPGAAVITLLAIDPTVSAGGGPITPGAAILRLAAVDPAVVLASLALTPAASVLTLAAIAPDVVLGAIQLTPGAAAITLAGIDPTAVLGAISVQPGAAVVRQLAINPRVASGAVLV